MNATRALALVFFLFAGYGLGQQQNLTAVFCFGMVGLMVYAEGVFKRQDREWEKVQRAKRNLTLASETMIALHECETATPWCVNPATGLQVHD